MEIVFATKNAGKLREIIEVLSPIKVYSMGDLGIDIDVLEDGETFEENAIKKAEAIASHCGRIVLADDSGLAVDYLEGAPGVYSARYMGTDTPYSIKNAKIIELLSGVPFEKRTARFVCAIAAVFPETGEAVVRSAAIEGYVAYEPKGEGGFGYDPIFYLPEYNMTTAELTSAQKNAISHRGKALRMMREVFEKKGEL